MRETELYAPVKQFLEADGYEVKAEVRGCDVVACKPDAPTIVVELKLAYSLELVLQGIERQKIVDDVYLAIKRPNTTPKRRNWRRKQRAIQGLCRRLGLGLMLIDTEGRHTSPVDVLLDPAPYSPRKKTREHTRLKKEFLSRNGDPNTGGATRTKIVTAYRQDAIRCAVVLGGGKTLKVGEIRKTTGVERAGSILQKNHYGWFQRTDRGVYGLAESGEIALQHYADVVDALAP